MVTSTHSRVETRGWFSNASVDPTEARNGRLARVGVIDRSVERSPCARRCRRTEARESDFTAYWTRLEDMDRLQKGDTVPRPDHLPARLRAGDRRTGSVGPGRCGRVDSAGTGIPITRGNGRPPRKS